MPQASANSFLITALSKIKHSEKTLLIADENISSTEIRELQNFPFVSVISNRFDLAEICKLYKIPHYLNDFDFSECRAQQFTHYLYRISKEKPICHHIFNSISEQINTGSFIVFGRKNEGIKTYHQNLIDKLKFHGSLKKYNDFYLAELIKAPGTITKEKLNDQDYAHTQKLCVEEFNFTSKPGQYGWDKVDRGSQLLLKQLVEHSAFHAKPCKSVIDLGCGYGFLSMGILAASASFVELQRLTATDNNVAAVTCCAINLTAIKQALGRTGLETQTVLDDCGDHIAGGFDMLVCNPPFHQGFDTQKDLTDKFLASSKRLLNKHGCAWFVVNQFIPLEKLASHYFKFIKLLHSDGQFKVIYLSNTLPISP